MYVFGNHHSQVKYLCSDSGIGCSNWTCCSRSAVRSRSGGTSGRSTSNSLASAAAVPAAFEVAHFHRPHPAPCRWKQVWRLGNVRAPARSIRPRRPTAAVGGGGAAGADRAAFSWGPRLVPKPGSTDAGSAGTRRHRNAQLRRQLPVYERLGDVRSLLVARANTAITLMQRGAPSDLGEARQLLELALAAAIKMRLPKVRQIQPWLGMLARRSGSGSKS